MQQQGSPDNKVVWVAQRQEALVKAYNSHSTQRGWFNSHNQTKIDVEKIVKTLTIFNVSNIDGLFNDQSMSSRVNTISVRIRFH